MAGNQSRGLVKASQTRGWDPTVIDNGDGTTTDISKWDYPSANLAPARNGSYVGVGPDAMVNPAEGDPTATAAEGMDFSVPDVGRENANRRTVGADPFVGGITGSQVGRPTPDRSLGFGISDVGGESPGMNTTDPSGTVVGGGS